MRMPASHFNTLDLECKTNQAICSGADHGQTTIKRRISIGLLSMLAAFLALVAGVPSEPVHAASGPFTIDGNKIIDGSGARFAVKGNDAVYGHFGGGDQTGHGSINYNNRARDLDNLKNAGVNLIRITVSADCYIRVGIVGCTVPPTQYLSELDATVSDVTSRGMVGEISNSDTVSRADVRSFVGMLAGRYRGNSLVWMKPDNEPNCDDGPNPGAAPVCYDWANWQTEETSIVQAIRNAGFTNPIVINCIDWSFDCSQIASYPLGDAKIIYGPHCYGPGGATGFDPNLPNGCNQIDANTSWANLASTYPIIVDEVGIEIPPLSSVSWGTSFLDWCKSWVADSRGQTE